MKGFLCLLLFPLALSGSAVENEIEIDYYWRDYDGHVPHDALEAGIDKAGKPIYIGQGLFLNDSVGLIPGTLHPDSCHLVVAAQNQVYETHDFVKILCTRHPKNFHWVKVEGYGEIAALTNEHLVEGGAEKNTAVHIGRALHEGSTEIGKVFDLKPSHVHISFPGADNKQVYLDQFELLIYKMEKTEESHEVHETHITKEAKGHTIYINIA